MLDAESGCQVGTADVFSGDDVGETVSLYLVKLTTAVTTVSMVSTPKRKRKIC